MIEQKLIVITLRDKIFLEEKSILKDELAKGWMVRDIKLGVGINGKHGFMTVLLDREWIEKKQTVDVVKMSSIYTRWMMENRLNLHLQIPRI